MPATDTYEKIGRILGIIEGMQEALERIETRQEGMATIMSEHIREDDGRDYRISDLEKWQKGENGEKGAEAQINDIIKKGVWLICFGSCISMIGGALATAGASKVGIWLTRVFG